MKKHKIKIVHGITVFLISANDMSPSSIELLGIIYYNCLRNQFIPRYDLLDIIDFNIDECIEELILEGVIEKATVFNETVIKLTDAFYDRIEIKFVNKDNEYCDDFVYYTGKALLNKD